MSSPTGNPTLNAWVDEIAKKTGAQDVVWCDGSEEEIAGLRTEFYAEDDPLSGTPGEDSAAVKSYLSYAGPYEYQGDRVVHRVTQSSFPNWVGSEQIRKVRFEDDPLELSAGVVEIGHLRQQVGLCEGHSCRRLLEVDAFIPASSNPLGNLVVDLAVDHIILFSKVDQLLEQHRVGVSLGSLQGDILCRAMKIVVTRQLFVTE